MRLLLLAGYIYTYKTHICIQIYEQKQYVSHVHIGKYIDKLKCTGIMFIEHNYSNKHTHKHIYTHTHKHTYIHIDTHTHTHIYIYIYIL